MTATTVTLLQGTDAWHQHRAKHFNASEAPAMLGVSSYKSRAELLHEKATGLVPDVDDATQRRFDLGHEYEAIARPWAEEIIGAELFPVVLVDTAEIPLSASLDGLTLLGDVAFEHKTLNARLADALDSGVIPEEYHPQMEQQLMLSGADKCLFMASNGDRGTMRHAWYLPNPEMRARLLAGWKQFAEDLAAYQHRDAAAAPIGQTIGALPVPFVQIEGRVIASNMDAFKAAAESFIDRLPKQLSTDQDFANAERAVKDCKDAEDRLAAVKAAAQAQAVSIDEVFRTLDAIRDRVREARLALDKQVKAEKERRRAELVRHANEAIVEHIRKLNDRVAPGAIPAHVFPSARLAEAIKGLKSLDSMRDALDTAMANIKIEANAMADQIDINRKALASNGVPDAHLTLFPDFAYVCTKPTEDFANLLAARIDADRKRTEAEAAKRDADRVQETPRAIAAVTAGEIPVESHATLKLGDISNRLGFTVTSEFLASMGYQHITRDKNAKLYREADFPRICQAIANHVLSVAADANQPAAIAA